MKRHAAKHWPKHVRRMTEALLKIGAVAIRVEVAGRYLVSWTFGEIAMRIGMALSPSGSAFENAWTCVRRLFRQHRLAVPA